LSMTQRGTLLFPAWDDTLNEYSIFAIPGILKLGPVSTSKGGLSSGAAAGVTITVLLVVLGGAFAYLVQTTGSVSAAVSKLGLSSVLQGFSAKSAYTATPSSSSAASASYSYSAGSSSYGSA
jgi:hypothetical protein